jgi:GntR family transcriptional regulator, transcriptional repressor for pyruvate dehydrogenase complex
MSRDLTTFRPRFPWPASVPWKRPCRRTGEGDLSMHAQLQPLQKRTLGQQAFEQLLAFIQSGNFHPGDALPSQHELARSLSVSRPILREAMQRLAAAGVIEIRHGSGCYVTDPIQNGSFDELLGNFTREMTLEVLETRTIVETEIAALAAARASEDDLARMEQALEQIRRLRAQGGLTVSGDADFHRALALASHNRVLTAIWDLLHQPSYIQGIRVQLALPNVVTDDYDNHRLLYEAVRSGDPERARETARVHLGRAHGWAHQIDTLRREIAADGEGDSGTAGQAVGTRNAG